MQRIDARVPVRFGAAADARAHEAVLAEREADPLLQPSASFTPRPPVHAAGCACCASRTEAGRALSDLFTHRARGGIEFSAVLVVTATDLGRRDVEQALRADPFASARFRLAP